MPYVYAPWLLPLFVPWALLPWDVAWFAWRAANLVLLAWSIGWAYRIRPLATAVTVIAPRLPVHRQPRHREHQPACSST